MVRWHVQHLASIRRQRQRFQDDPDYTSEYELETEDGLFIILETSTSSSIEYLITE